MPVLPPLRRVGSFWTHCSVVATEPHVPQVQLHSHEWTGPDVPTTLPIPLVNPAWPSANKAASGERNSLDVWTTWGPLLTPSWYLCFGVLKPLSPPETTYVSSSAKTAAHLRSQTLLIPRVPRSQRQAEPTSARGRSPGNESVGHRPQCPPSQQGRCWGSRGMGALKTQMPQGVYWVTAEKGWDPWRVCSLHSGCESGPGPDMVKSPGVLGSSCKPGLWLGH